MLYVSEKDSGVTGEILIPKIPGYDEQQINHHVILCEEAGYLDIKIVQNSYGQKTPVSIVRMTWAGYEALESRCQNGLR